jgi:hypothetical protein
MTGAPRWEVRDPRDAVVSPQRAQVRQRASPTTSNAERAISRRRKGPGRDSTQSEPMARRMRRFPRSSTTKPQPSMSNDALARRSSSGCAQAVSALSAAPAEAVRELLKYHVAVDERVIVSLGAEEDDAFKSIRCPLCAWHPDQSSRWCCDASESPEPFFPGCRTVWNTFLTRGRCPGCSHQWTWTSCLRCHGWSLHVDWYDEQQNRSPH